MGEKKNKMNIRLVSVVQPETRANGATFADTIFVDNMLYSQIVVQPMKRLEPF